MMNKEKTLFIFEGVKTESKLIEKLEHKMIRCSELIRRDQYPANSYFNGSGLPIPVYGYSAISFSKSVIFFMIALLPDFFQYSRSFSACSRKI